MLNFQTRNKWQGDQVINILKNPKKNDREFIRNPNNHNLNRPKIIQKNIRVKGDNVKKTINQFLENIKKFVELWRVSGLLMFNFKIKNK